MGTPYKNVSKHMSDSKSEVSEVKTKVDSSNSAKIYTIAYIYDIPKEDNYSSAELTQILSQLGYKCSVQINRHSSSKPFLSAMVKFDSVAQLQLALMNHKSFKLRDSKKEARLLPFDPALKKNVHSK